MASPVITLAGDAEPHSSTQIVGQPGGERATPHGASTASRYAVGSSRSAAARSLKS